VDAGKDSDQKANHQRDDWKVCEAEADETEWRTVTLGAKPLIIASDG
jgi:hypothetical protein